MPVSLDAAHYFWHRLTTEKTPLEEVVAKRNRDKGDGLTPEEVGAFMLEVKKRLGEGDNIMAALDKASGKSRLEVAAAPAPAKTSASKAKKARKG